MDVALHAAQEELHRAHVRLVTRVEANLGLDLLLEGVSGRGGGRRLASRGLALLRSAAANGDAEAMHNLGVAHERGLGERPSAKKVGGTMTKHVFFIVLFCRVGVRRLMVYFERR